MTVSAPEHHEDHSPVEVPPLGAPGLGIGQQEEGGVGNGKRGGLWECEGVGRVGGDRMIEDGVTGGLASWWLQGKRGNVLMCCRCEHDCFGGTENHDSYSFM